jgi:2-polyprenyl-3-methyl-5-hydroxy-6-metoxy-1,4-benzoquinol methylase
MIKKRKLVEKCTGIKSGNLLDVGSGTGSFVNEMKQNGWLVTGLEPDKEARKTAGQLYSIELADAKAFYQLSPGSFDAITLWHVLEHVHDLSVYVEQLRILLSEKGRL